MMLMMVMMMPMMMKVFCVSQILYQTLTGLKKDLSGVQTVRHTSGGP